MAVALPLAAGPRPAAGPAFPGRPPVEAAVCRAPRAAGGRLADGGGLDVAPDVRPQVRAVQPDHRLVRRTAGRAVVDRQAAPRLSGRSSSPRSGSGRRSCSSFCWRRSPTCDRDQLEAAEIDGAGRFRVFFRHVVLPAIMPVWSIAVLIRALDLFRIFDAVWQLTRGGPGNQDRDLVDLHVRQGLSELRDELYRGPGRGVLLILLSVVVTFALQRMEIAR